MKSMFFKQCCCFFLADRAWQHLCFLGVRFCPPFCGAMLLHFLDFFRELVATFFSISVFGSWAELVNSIHDLASPVWRCGPSRRLFSIARDQASRVHLVYQAKTPYFSGTLALRARSASQISAGHHCHWLGLCSSERLVGCHHPDQNGFPICQHALIQQLVTTPVMSCTGCHWLHRFFVTHRFFLCAQRPRCSAPALESHVLPCVCRRHAPKLVH